jgi:apolipoprotein D and lipocalin family protein
MKRPIQRRRDHVRKGLVAALMTLAGCAGAGCAGQLSATGPARLPLARQVDLSRIYGGWHIVATIPNGFERGMLAPYDVYSPRPDGSIREDFYVRRGSFSAPLKHFVVKDFIKPGTEGASWEVQIFWPLRLPFLLLYVDPDNRYVIFGEESRQLGWIYARDPKISDLAYQEALDRLVNLGYDRLKFRKIIQTADQIGQPGFWSDGVHQGEGRQDAGGAGSAGSHP